MFFKMKSTYDWLQQQMGSNVDAMIQHVQSEEKKVHLIYLKSLCEEKKIQEVIVKPFYESKGIEEYRQYIHSLSNREDYQDDAKTLQAIFTGKMVVFLSHELHIVDVKKSASTAIDTATVETVIQGPQNALSESTLVNIQLIRDRYRKTTLFIEEQTLNTYTERKVTLLYDQNRVDHKALKEVKERLFQVQADTVQAVGELAKLMNGKKRTLFPTMMITERPDRIALTLTQGKIVVLLEGTPFALIVPAVFFDFMSSMEDVYQSWGISRFLLSLRYFGLVISLTLPGIYVAVTSYNPELFRVQLALSIAGSRVGVPYPSYVEVLFMLLMMEMLVEASVRLPKAIGPTATTVGGLILGTAATDATLVSTVMIIIVASVAISNFVIPINAMGFAMRVTKYFLLLLAIFYGTNGLVVGLLLLGAWLCHFESFGQPYLRVTFFKGEKLLNPPEEEVT